MPWLIGFFAQFFVRLFGGAGTFLAGFFAQAAGSLVGNAAGLVKKLLIFALVVAAIGAAINLLAAGISALAAQLGIGLPLELLEVGRMLLPGNIPYCLSLLVVARVKSLVFYWVSKLSEKMIHT